MNNLTAEDPEPYLIDISKYKLSKEHPIISTFSSIYFIEDEESHQYVAKTIKDINSNYEKEFFSREIKIYLKLQHQTIVAMPGFSFKNIQLENKITFIMKRMMAGSLSDLFKPGENNQNLIKIFNDNQKQIILVGTAFGMMLLHSNNIINRDLKPENILLYDDYKPCLTDFNRSKSFNPLNQIDQSMAQATLAYIAPEATEYNNPVYGTPADVFSFGILMLEILKGERVMKNVNMSPLDEHEYLNKVKLGYRPDIDQNLRNKYPALANLIDECLEYEPEKRPTFVTIFKRLSLLNNEFFKSYEEKFPFMNEYCSKGPCGFINESNAVKDYAKELLNELKQEKVVNDAEFQKMKKTSQHIFQLPEFDVKIPPQLEQKDKELLFNLSLFFPNKHERKSIDSDHINFNFKQFSDFFNFPIVSENMNLILENLNLFDSEEGFNICTFFTFYTWASFGIRILQEKPISNVIPLLKILNHIMKITANKEDKKSHRDVAKLCFANLIALIVAYDLIKDFDSFVEETLTFYLRYNTIDILSNDVFYVLSSKLIDSNQQLSSQAINLIKIATRILTHDPKFFNQKVIMQIFNSTKSKIVEFDLNCLSFFAKSAHAIHISESSAILRQLVNNTLSKHFIAKDNNDENPSTNAQLKSNNNNLETLIHPPKDLDQINKVPNTDDPTNFRYNELSSFLDKESIPSLPFLEEIVRTNEEYAKYFISEALNKLQSFDIKKSKSLYFEQFAFMIHLITLASKKFPSASNQVFNKQNSSILDNKDIFDPNITSFSKKENEEIIISLRHYIIQLLLGNQANILKQILQRCSSYPKLFRDCICHIALIARDDLTMNLWRISDVLFESLATYRVNSDTTNLSEDDKFNLTIRKSIYKCIESFRLIDEELNESFKSQVFVKSYFILLMEPPIRDHINNFLLNYLKSVQLTENDEDGLNYILKRITDLFKICCNEMPESEGISLMSDLLTKINAAMESNRSIVSKFESISSTLNHIVMEIDVSAVEAENLDDLLIPLIEFLFKIYQQKAIDDVDASLLETLVTHFLPKLTKSKVIVKLFQIASNEKLSIISPTFEIKQKQILYPIVRVFINTNQFYNILNFISLLCSYSTENCFRCHECQFDLFIIDIIAEWVGKIHELIPKKEFTSQIREEETLPNYFDENNEIVVRETEEGLIINEELVDSLLNIFSQIASSVSSVLIVQRFFSTLCLPKPSQLSIIHKHIMKSFSSIIEKSTKTPSAPFPISSGEISITNIPKSSIEEGFCFSFWVSFSFSENNVQQNLFNLTDDKNIFSVKFGNRSFDIYVKSGTKFINFNMPIDSDPDLVPNKQWVMITVKSTFDKNKNQSIITLYVDQKIVKERTLALLFMTEPQLKCIVNCQQNDDNADPHLIGLFMMSSLLTNEEITNLAKKGQRSSDFPYADKTIFGYKPRYNKRKIVFSPTHKMQNINEKYPVINASKIAYSFVDILKRQYNLEKFIPLFSIFDDQIKDPHPTEILSKLFRLDEDFQASFCMSRCFNSIANLLLESDKSNITFKLYQYYEKLHDCIINEDLRIQLFEDILLNFNLWSKSQSKEQQKIFNNWKNLYYSFSDLIKSIKKPEWFIFNSQECYDLNNLQDETFCECRKSFYSIILKYFEKNFSVDYISLIISIILHHDSLIKKKDIFEGLLLEIIYNDAIITQVKTNLSSIVHNTHKILIDIKVDDIIFNDIIFNVIQIFVRIYKLGRGCIDIPLHILIQIIIQILFVNNEYQFPFDKFSSLIQIMNQEKVVELLPLLCLAAINGDVSYAKELNSNMDKSLKYYINETSAFYPALLIFRYYEEKKDLIKLNVTLFKNNLIDLINVFNVIGLSGYNILFVEEILHDIFKYILEPNQNHIIEANSKIDLFHIITNFIISGSSRYFQNQYNNEIDDNNYSLTEDFEIFKKLHSAINEKNLSKEKIQFSLRFTGVHSISPYWKDEDLSENIFNLFQNIINDGRIKIEKKDKELVIIKINIISSFLNLYATKKGTNIKYRISTLLNNQKTLSQNINIKIETYNIGENKYKNSINSYKNNEKQFDEKKKKFVTKFSASYKEYLKYEQSLFNMEKLQSNYNEFYKLHNSSTSSLLNQEEQAKRVNQPARVPQKKSFVPKMSIPFSIGNSKNNLIVVHFNGVSHLASAFASLSPNGKTILFKTIDFEGNFKSFSIETTSFSSSPVDLFETSSQNILTFVKSINSPLFIDENRFCVINHNENSVTVMNSQNWMSTEIQTETEDEINFIDSCGSWVAVSKSDTAVTLCNVDLIPQSSNLKLFTSLTSKMFGKSSTSSFHSSNDRIPLNDSEISDSSSSFYSGTVFSFRSLVTCVGIAPNFNLVVCGTNDKQLLFCELCLGEIRVNKVVQTEGRPEKVVITEKHGFIAVLTTKPINGFLLKNLVLYNREGEEIRSAQINVAAMATAPSCSGDSDFLIVADDENKVFALDANYLNVGEPIAMCKSKIIQLACIREGKLVVAFHEDGEASIIHAKNI